MEVSIDGGGWFVCVCVCVCVEGDTVLSELRGLERNGWLFKH